MRLFFLFQFIFKDILWIKIRIVFGYDWIDSYIYYNWLLKNKFGAINNFLLFIDIYDIYFITFIDLYSYVVELYCLNWMVRVNIIILISNGHITKEKLIFISSVASSP